MFSPPGTPSFTLAFPGIQQRDTFKVLAFECRKQFNQPYAVGLEWVHEDPKLGTLLTDLQHRTNLSIFQNCNVREEEHLQCHFEHGTDDVHFNARSQPEALRAGELFCPECATAGKANS